MRGDLVEVDHVFSVFAGEKKSADCHLKVLIQDAKKEKRTSASKHCYFTAKMYMRFIKVCFILKLLQDYISHSHEVTGVIGVRIPFSANNAETVLYS